MAGALVYVYIQLFQPPLTPIYFDGDVMTPVSNAIRILAGEVIYRDFFHFIAPGADLTYALLFEIFGQKVLVINAVILLLTLSQTALILYLSRKIFSGLTVLVPATLFLVVVFRSFGIDGSYRMFSIVFVFAAVASIARPRTTERLVAAGGLCGLASFFVQTRGAMAIIGIVAFLLWEGWSNGSTAKAIGKRAVALVLPFFAFTTITQAYFAWQAGWNNYYFAMIQFARDHYPKDPFNNFGAYLSDLPPISTWLEYSPFSGYFRTVIFIAFFYLLVPLVFLAFFAFCIRKRRILKNDPRFPLVMLLSLVGLFVSIGVSAPTGMRLAQVSGFALLILVWLLSQFRWSGTLMPIACCVVVLLAIAHSVHRLLSPKYELTMPAGTTSFLKEELYERYRWIGQNTAPGDSFYEPHHPNYYFPFHLRNPTPLYMARDSDYTPKFQVDMVIKALESDPPRFIVWPRNWSKPPEARQTGDNLEPLWQFVSGHYRPKHVFPRLRDQSQSIYDDNEVWELAR